MDNDSEINSKLSLKQYYIVSIVLYFVASYLVNHLIMTHGFQYNFIKTLIGSAASVIGVLYIFSRNNKRTLTNREVSKLAFISSFICLAIYCIIILLTKLTLNSFQVSSFTTLVIMNLPLAFINFILLILFYKWFGNLFIKEADKVSNAIQNDKVGLLGKLFNTPSIACFTISIIIIILQLIPYTGVMLLMLGVHLWNGYLISFAFASLVIEVILKKIARWTIILPILYYGGYWFYVIPDHIKMDKLQTESNVNNNIPFHPDKHSLVFNISLYKLLERYDLPVAYTDRVFDTSQGKYLSQRITGKNTCLVLRKKTELLKLNIFAINSETSSSDICTVMLPEDPILPIFKISSSSKHEVKKNHIYENKNRELFITDPNGKEHNLSIIKERVYNKFPVPYFKCTLTQMNTKWGCGYGFHRTRYSSYLSEIDIIARALGLKQLDASERYNADTKNHVLDKKLKEIFDKYKNN